MSEKTIELDSLTNLKTLDHLKNLICNRKNILVALADIDNLRDTNKHSGYDMGDQVLQIAGMMLKDYFSEIDGYEVYRLYGDTFAISAIYSQENYNETYEKLDDLLSFLQKENTSMREFQYWFQFTVGIGYGLGMGGLVSAEEHLDEAKEKRVRIVAAHNKDRFFIDYSQNIIQRDRVREAINNDNIIPYFQPIESLDSNAIEKFECLARLMHNGETIPPNVFIEASKDIKMYDSITRSMILKSFKEFSEPAYKDMQFSLNLDPVDLQNNDTMKYLIEKVEEFDVGSRLIVEVLETKSWDSNSELLDLFQELKSMGIKIAIDDFGSGHSNFDTMLKINPDIIKIDGSLISKIEKGVIYDAVKSIVDLAKSVGAETVAEYVESEEIKRECIRAGVDFIQGYLISAPVANISEVI